ncbi:hypothetical protein HD554DRAFT_267569 [Boletus coccyginus]|nr:hypothetical protein HD554DRAFT_267569 [Boletus coccyginus]
MDDDVQYLGTRLAATENLDDPCHAHRPVAGITLHVEKCGDRPAHDLTFYRARSAYVNVGRKSGSDDRSMRRENDDHNAVFTCQVVSARHAKLFLTDSGQVYIVDLHSRHGTHLSRRGETAPRTLQPDVDTLLADGDVLTFGKVVGAGSYHVSPVTVRVELLTGPSPPSEPSADRVRIASHPSSPVLEVWPRKLCSGRYGLISTSIIESDSPQSSSSISVSSDEASSQSDQESDLDDEHGCVPTVFWDTQGKPSVKIPAFRSFIREICHSAISHPSDIPDEPLGDAPGSPFSDIVIQPSPVVVAEPFPVPRSPSPIDLITPPPPSEAKQSEPAVIGAWPASRPESPRHTSLEVEAGQSEVPLVLERDSEPEPVPAPPSPCHTRFATKTLSELVQCLNPPPYFSTSGPFSNSIRIKSEFKGSFKNVEDRITALQETVGDLKSRQSVTEEDVVDLQSHVEMLEPDSERLICRITGAERNIATLSTLQGKMTVLQNQVTTLRSRLDASEEPRPVETPMDDVRACADALNNLVSEMKVLREDVEKRIDAKMEAIQSARAEALDALKGVVAEAESMKSSKRKRGDDEEVEEETPEVVAVAQPVAHSPPVVVDEIPLPEVSIPQIPIPQLPIPVPDLPVPIPVLAPVPTPKVPAPEIPALDSEPARPKKRARTAMHTVAHTAAAMVVGAAATWSALAFS